MRNPTTNTSATQIPDQSSGALFGCLDVGINGVFNGGSSAGSLVGSLAGLLAGSLADLTVVQMGMMLLEAIVIRTTCLLAKELGWQRVLERPALMQS